MKKLVLFFTFLIGLMSLSPLHGAFERVKNFFTGNRYYYDTDGYYYGGDGSRYYYTYSYPRYYYSRPRYVYSDRVVNSPVVDTKSSINEDDNQYIITLLVPGYEKSNIQVTALDRSVQVNANAPRGVSVNGSTLPKLSSIEQIVPLNAHIKPDAVTSSYVNGVLTITAPKFYSSRAISVPIQ